MLLKVRPSIKSTTQVTIYLDDYWLIPSVVKDLGEKPIGNQSGGHRNSLSDQRGNESDSNGKYGYHHRGGYHRGGQTQMRGGQMSYRGHQSRGKQSDRGGNRGGYRGRSRGYYNPGNRSRGGGGFNRGHME